MRKTDMLAVSFCFVELRTVRKPAEAMAGRPEPWSRTPASIQSEGQMKIETVVRSIGGLQQEIVIGPHRLVADEPPENGGQDAGPSPFGLLTAALGA